MSNGKATVVRTVQRSSDRALEDRQNVQSRDRVITVDLVRGQRSRTTPALVQAVEQRVSLVEGQPGWLGTAVIVLVDDSQLAVGKVEGRDHVVVVSGSPELDCRDGNGQEEGDEADWDSGLDHDCDF